MRDSSLLDVDRVRIGIGGATLFVVTAVLVVADVSLVAFASVTALVTAVLASTVSRSGALLLGVTGWALCTGFGVNELGQLTFAEADLVRLAAYVAGAVALGSDRVPAQ